MNTSRIRLTSSCLVLSGTLFFLFPVVRPFFDESSLEGAAKFASTSWVIAHALGMGGFMLLSLGFLGMHAYLRETRGENQAFLALILSWIGSGLTLPFFGAEAFGLQVIGKAVVNMNNSALIPLINSVRFGPGIIFILSGLALIVIASILFALAIWRSGILPKWSGIPLAIGLSLFAPLLQGNPLFQLMRIADGLLIAIGCILPVWYVSKHKKKT